MIKVKLDSTNQIVAWCTIGGMDDVTLEVEALPEGNPLDYKLIDGQYVYAPAPAAEQPPELPSLESRMDAVQAHNEQQDLTIDDMVLLMAEMIGGE